MECSKSGCLFDLQTVKMLQDFNPEILQKNAECSSTFLAWHPGFWPILQSRHHSFTKTIVSHSSFAFYQQWSCQLKRIGPLEKIFAYFRVTKGGQCWWDGQDTFLVPQGPASRIFVSVGKITARMAPLEVYSIPVWESGRQSHNHHILLCWLDEYPSACSVSSHSHLPHQRSRSRLLCSHLILAQHYVHSYIFCILRQKVCIFPKVALLNN